MLRRKMMLGAGGNVYDNPDEPPEENVSEYPPVPHTVRLDLCLAFGKAVFGEGSRVLLLALERKLPGRHSPGPVAQLDVGAGRNRAEAYVLRCPTNDGGAPGGPYRHSNEGNEQKQSHDLPQVAFGR